MKQGKGQLWSGHICRECGQRIEASADGVTYWAYEHANHVDYRGWNSERAYYHRSCGRKVTARRVAERARMLAEIKAAPYGVVTR